MVLVDRRKMYRKVYTGGLIHPALQVATQAGTAILPFLGKSHLKKLLAGVLSGIGTTMLIKGIERGNRIMSKTLGHKLNLNTPMNETLKKLLAISPFNQLAQPVASEQPTGVTAIDREVIPIKNQLMAQTANINVTEARSRELNKGFENLGIDPVGYGRKMPAIPPSMTRTRGSGIAKLPHISNALNKRADMLLRNIVS